MKKIGVISNFIINYWVRYIFFIDVVIRVKYLMGVWVYMDCICILKLVVIVFFDIVLFEKVECMIIWEVCKYIYKEKIKECLIFSDVKIVVDDILRGKLFFWKLVVIMEDIVFFCNFN